MKNNYFSEYLGKIIKLYSTDKNKYLWFLVSYVNKKKSDFAFYKRVIQNFVFKQSLYL